MGYADQLGSVIVVGGGFTGTVAAAGFSALGLRTTVLEGHASFDPRFRGELIHPRGVRALELLGLKQTLVDAGAAPVQGFAVTADRDVPVMQLPYPVDGGNGLGVEHRAMVGALRHAVSARPNVTVRQSARVESLVVENERVVGVKLQDGEELRADLIVGADGRASKVRRLLGLDPEVRLLSYTLAVTVEGEHTLPCDGFGHVFLGAPGPILAYPFGANAVRMCIDVPLGRAQGKAALRELVKREYAPFVPEPLRTPFLAALEEQGVEGCANQSIHTERCAVPGAVLIGDAAGCSHPLTANGMTIGTHDVLTLTAALRGQPTEEKALLEYQRRRYRFVRPREIFTDALYEVFSGRDEGTRVLRAGTFRYWNTGPRARAKSMAILAGDESGPITFATEYARVMGLSTLELSRPGFSPRAVVTNLRRLKALFDVSFDRLEQTVGQTVKTLVAERRSSQLGRAA